MSIIVHVGRQRDGATFVLSPHTRVMLSSRWPEHSPAAASVFVSYASQEGFKRLHDPMWSQIVMLLTGLTEEQIRKSGGFAIVDPAESEVFFNSNAHAA
jgi:hypothetical protein